MSLVGFRAGNHAQQVKKRGARDDVDDRGTSPAFIARLEERFGPFNLDVAAAPHNKKAPVYLTIDLDGLRLHWQRPRNHQGAWNVWCNPPYSDCGAWVQKAWSQWLRHPQDLARSDGAWPNFEQDRPTRSPDHIVMLLPANRCEQRWWQDFVEPFRDRPGSPLRVEFLPGRMRFDRPGVAIGPKGDRPPFGCCLLIWERPLNGALSHAWREGYERGHVDRDHGLSDIEYQNDPYRV